jgi:hypothetical protein
MGPNRAVDPRIARLFEGLSLSLDWTVLVRLSGGRLRYGCPPCALLPALLCGLHFLTPTGHEGTFRHRIVAHISSYHPLICLGRRLDTRLVFHLPQRADDMLEAGELARADQMKRLIDKTVLLYLPCPTGRKVGKEWGAIV